MLLQMFAVIHFRHNLMHRLFLHVFLRKGNDGPQTLLNSLKMQRVKICFFLEKIVMSLLECVLHEHQEELSVLQNVLSIILVCGGI